MSDSKDYVNPYTDRQNLAGDEAGALDEETVAEASLDEEGITESDIEEYVPDDTAEEPGDDAPRNHDDQDPWGDGVHETPLTQEYEGMAERADLARTLEDLAADAYDWAQRTEDADAQEIYETLADLAERVGNPPEDTIAIEPEELPEDRTRADGRD